MASKLLVTRLDMANTQLERISAKIKAIQPLTIPPVPKLPERFVRQWRLEEFDAEWELWRQQAQEAIRDALRAIQSQSPSE